MKMADLLDEHGYRWFPRADIVFGIIWGVIGVILIVADQTLATVWLAILACWLVRRRLDYLNHGIAGALWLVAGLAGPVVVDRAAFVCLAVIFSVSGLIHDHFQYRGELPKKAWVKFLDVCDWCLIAGGYSVYSHSLLPVLSVCALEYAYLFLAKGRADAFLGKFGWKPPSA